MRRGAQGSLPVAEELPLSGIDRERVSEGGSICLCFYQICDCSAASRDLPGRSSGQWMISLRAH